MTYMGQKITRSMNGDHVITMHCSKRRNKYTKDREQWPGCGTLSRDRDDHILSLLNYSREESNPRRTGEALTCGS